MDWDYIASLISSETGRKFEVRHAKPVAGGSISQAVRLEGADNARYFVKFNDVRHLDMFVAEAQGLNAIAATNTLHVPKPVVHGTSNGRGFLVLEYLELGARGNARKLGEGLAELHRRTAQEFGFAQDNFIGTTRQPNGMHENWVKFWQTNRLGFQLELARHNGYQGKLQELGEELSDRLQDFFAGYQPEASLLHGDLWGGNHAYLQDGTPALFDPAIYYGDREADIAMTELFGGYAADFYAAYQAAWPLDEGYSVRRDLYNLYHILNHANLFGSGYAHEAEGMMRSLLAQIS